MPTFPWPRETALRPDAPRALAQRDNHGRHHSRWTVGLASAVLGLLGGCGGGSEPAAQGTAIVLSSRADAVSDGSALVKIQPDAGSDPEQIKVRVNGRDITSRFHPDDQGNLVGLVTGLPLGKSRLAVGTDTSRDLTLTNWSADGPIVSGPHQTPWICSTAQFKLPDGSTLGAPLDPQCNAPAKVLYLYLPQGGDALVPLPSTSALPFDVSTIETLDGKTVNFIVRLETGTINRAIYQFAFLSDPTIDTQTGPTQRYQAWNRKIIVNFGGHAAAGYYQGLFQVTNERIIDQRALLSKGYALITSTLNVFGNNANDVLSGETAALIKEKFIKSYGAPIYTIGYGGSGGSIQQQLIANNYPGVLDGILPSASFPDIYTVVQSTMDCSLLARAFDASEQRWSEAQKTAAAGYYSIHTCTAPAGGWNAFYSPLWLMAMRSNHPLSPVGPNEFFDANNCKQVVPESALYHPVTNPTGVRCDLYSNAKMLLGVDPATAQPARGWDNVGVQYGLQAYRSGIISPEQFVELNERMGGYDNDGNFQPDRTVASPVALNNMFEFGRVNLGGNLGATPVIDYRNYGDQVANAQVSDNHDSVRSVIMRARLVRSNGHADNHVILRTRGTPLADFALAKMDEWLMSIANDTRHHASAAAKVAANKPVDLVDICIAADGTRIAELADFANSGRCGQIVPFHGHPRMVAGAPLTDDVLKCQLKPLLRSEHADLSSSQFARLQAVFPSGVCDYAQPSVGFKRLKGPWLAYSAPGVAAPLQ